MLRRHLRRLRRRRAGARMPVPSPAPAPKQGENVGLDLDRRAGKYQNRSVIRGMRILLTTFDPIFLLPPTHPSGSCGSTVHAVRGVGLGFASCEPQEVSTESESE